jgi:hypothetical protein
VWPAGPTGYLEPAEIHQAEKELTTLAVLRYGSGHRKGRLKILSIVPVARHASVVSEHVAIPVDGLGILGAGVPGVRAGVIADVVEDALAVIEGGAEFRVGCQGRVRELALASLISPSVASAQFDFTGGGDQCGPG